jgi:hypothetical protein
MVLRTRTALALAATTATLAASAVTLGGARAASPATLSRASSGTEVTLVTGERVLETRSATGRPEFTVVSSGVPVFIEQFGTATYLVDADALPFMGSELDPSLFSAGAASGASAGTAVVVDWHGSSAPAMPWLTDQRSVSPGVTDGVITAASGAVFRAALAQEPGSARGSWSGSLSGIDRISAQGGVTPLIQESPDFVQYTLTIDGVNAAGRPDTGDGLDIMNTDNSLKYAGFAFWNKGVIKLSVPSGHYSIFAEFFAFAKSGTGTLDMVVLNVDVKGNTTVTVDARTATSQLTVVTPRPTSSGSGNVLWQRVDAHDTGSFASAVGWSIGGGLPPFRVFVTPTPAPKVGTQQWVASFNLDSSPVATTPPYSYDLAFGSQGAIRANQRYTVKSSQLASIDTSYFSDVPGRLSGESRLGLFPWQLFASGSFDALTAPYQRTEYVLGGGGIVWSQTVIDDYLDFAGLFFDSDNLFQPGEDATADWNRGPSGPGVTVDTGVVSLLQPCPVCFEQNTLEFLILPFSDNPPGHTAGSNEGIPGVTETDTATLDRDGVTLISGSDPDGPVPVPPGPGHYTLSYSVALSAPWWTLSTSTTTVWTFSTPRSLAGPPPAGFACFSGSTAGCSVVGLMFADYELPVSLLNQMPAGPVSFHLGIDHVLGASIATSHATVSVSFDGGTTWHTAHVAADGTSGFTVGYQNPPGPGTVSLRIHVTDADGGSLDQTILNAYGIS